MKGFHEYNSNDEIMSKAFIPSLILTGGLTGVWHTLCTRYRLFNKSATPLTVPVALFVSYYLTSGISQQYILAKEQQYALEEKRSDNLAEYYRSRAQV